MTTITDEFLGKLQAEIDRTNIAPSKMVKLTGQKHALALKIYGWLRGENKEAHPEIMELVLALYAKLLDVKKM